MTHKERVNMALEHRIPDRCPFYSSFTPEFAARLGEHLFSSEQGMHNPHGGGNTYEIERALGQDILASSVGWANSYYASERYNPGGNTYVDEWGVTWENIPYNTSYGRGYYTEIVGHPLDSDESINNFQLPDPTRESLYEDTRATVERFGDEYWIAGSVMTTVFESAWALRGLENLMMDIVIQPDLAEKILDFPFQYHLEVARQLTNLGVDGIWFGDDIGSQQAMMISPEMWRQFLKPRLATLIREVKSIRPSIKVIYHTDGCVFPVIPDLIEVGVDILNPIQPQSMDPRVLKRDFGQDLCFWGSIDEQQTLPFGTVSDVQSEVIERMHTMARGGGAILGPTHHVQLDTPLENFLTMVDTIKTTPCS